MANSSSSSSRSSSTSPSRSPSPSSAVVSILDNIALHKGILQSLQSSRSVDKNYQSDIEKSLNDLRVQLKALGGQEEDQPTNDPVKMESADFTTSILDNGMMGSSSEPKNTHLREYSAVGNDMTPSKHLSLPSRKRPREYLDSVFPPPKSNSRRHSPSPAPAVRPAPTPPAESFEWNWNDKIIRQFLGEDAESKYLDDEESLQDLERRKKEQEEADAALARKLQDEFGQEFPSFTSQTSAVKRNSTQSLLTTKGGIYRPMSAPPVKQEPWRMAASGSQSYPLKLEAYSLSSSSSGDDDSPVEEISAAQFQATTRHPHRSLSSNAFRPPSLHMPGAFPGFIDLTVPAGSSVYNNNGYQPAYRGYYPSPALYLPPTGLAGPSFRPVPSSYAPDRSIDLNEYRIPVPSYYTDPDKTQEEIKALLKQVRPDEELMADPRAISPKQMTIKLYDHQKLGLAWMSKMEEQTSRGGILADDMGLGKTLQALALILARPPPQDGPKPTLIVAPLALLDQWKKEAQSRIMPAHRLSVHLLHGEGRKIRWDYLKDKDVILTTYGVLASELKALNEWHDERKLNPDAPLAKALPLLGPKSRFHRVILDEAQMIKNKTSRAAVAACQLRSEYRWCMTGTPMQNRVEELYSLIRFCRIAPYNNWDHFSKLVVKPLKGRVEHAADAALKRLQVLCRAILLRRTKTSEVNGKPILDKLPPKTVTEARVRFSDDERDFYKALEASTQLQFNKYVREGTIGKHYSNALVLLLRLRQACCHPHLIKDFRIHTGGMEGLNLIENARELSADVVTRLKLIEEAFECPICMDPVLNPLIFYPCGHTLCEDCLGKLVDQAANNEGGPGDISCPACRTKINTLKTTDYQSFLRVFCPEREGVEPLSDEADNAGEDESSSDESGDEDDDDGDSDDGSDLDDFIVPDDEPLKSDTEDEEEKKYAPGQNPFEKSQKVDAKGKGKEKAKAKEGKKPKHKRKGKGKRTPRHAHMSLAQLRKEGLRNKIAKEEYIERLEKDWQPSAKIEKTLELLEEIHERGRGEKTIVFSGFTSFLDLLEVPIHQRPHFSDYVRYDGSLTLKERNSAVVKFSEDPTCRIILMSLKAGNAGLNLTAANNIIILDPHWNPYVEAQAQDRAHRIGQQLPVHIYRVLIGEEDVKKPVAIESTVEDRILRLQNQKMDLVESVLDENVSRENSRLGVKQLGYLFGVHDL